MLCTAHNRKGRTLLVLGALGLAGCAGRAAPNAATGDPGSSHKDGISPSDGGGRADGTGHDGPGLDAGWVMHGRWITLKPGAFTMGSPDSEPCRLINEKLHKVTLTHAFRISSTEVTQKDYLALTGESPSFFHQCGRTCPVERASWSGAVAYCNYLSGREGLQKCYTCVGDGVTYSRPFDCIERPEYRQVGGKPIYDCPGYRLPTEAEWEYAYRAGTSTALVLGHLSDCLLEAKASSVAWYSVNSGSRPHVVATRQANPWGLFDMAGNVWEWVNDWYQLNLGGAAVTDPVGPKLGQDRVLRGGSWTTSAGGVRAARRANTMPDQTMSFVGFRCVRTETP